MEDLPTSLLMQQEKAKPRTGEELETFGKHAASIYLNGKCKTLSEAVVETVKSAGLAPEQVKRVVEFTNQGAYLQKFASEGPNHKVINFKGGPASFPDVIRDLNDGGGGSVFDKAASSMMDYLSPPPDVEAITSRNLVHMGLMDDKLAAAFSVNEVPTPFEDPLRDAHDMRDKIAGLVDEANHELSGLETRYMDVCDLLFQQVKQASLDGVPLGHIVVGMSSVTQDPEFFKAAFTVLGPRLVDNQVFRSHAELSSSLEKTAGAGLINPAHPLIGVFEDFCSTLEKMAATRIVHDDAIEQLGVLSTYLQKAGSTAEAAGSTIKGVVGHIPKAWRAATGLAARASEPVSEFATGLGGETTGQIAGGAVKYAPHAAVALAGEEAYQRAKNNPAIQAAKNFAVSRIPYTHQNMVRQYNMQMGY